MNQSIKCSNHVEQPAEFYCTSCEGVFCAQCIKNLQLGNTFAYICHHCKGRCVDFKEMQEEESEQAEISYARDFWLQFKGVFLYPFKGDGAIILIQGTLGLILVTLPSHFMGMGPSAVKAISYILFLPFIIFFMMACCMVALQEMAASDSNQPPNLPDFFQIESWFGGGFMFLLAVGWSLVPALTYFLSVDGLDVYFWLLFVFGLYVMPMYILFAAREEYRAFFNPLKVVMSISKNVKPYSVIPLFWLVLFFLALAAGKVLSVEKANVYGFVFNRFIIIYFMFVAMRPLGVFYRAYEDRLVGFNVET